MDNQNSSYFYYGGIFSVTFFIFLLGTLYFIIYLEVSDTMYTQTDNTMISINLDAVKLSEKDARAIEKMASPVEPLNTPLEDIDDVFDSIVTEEIDYSKNPIVKETKPVVEQEFLKKIQTRTKIKHEKDTSHKQQSDPTLNLEHSKFESIEKDSQSSGGVHDVYKAKVHALLYRGWRHSSESFRRVRVNIHISSTGKMNYEVKQVSGDSLFDSSLKAHLEYLLGTIFPIPPDGKSVNFKVDFTTKGK